MRKIAAVLCLLALPAFAQTTGSLTGNVSPHAKLTLTSPSLQGERQTTANASGAYLFEALPPGEYTLHAEGIAHPVRVQLGLVTRFDIVNVTADAPTAVDAPEISTNLTLREIERLPIQRNQLATAQFAPGVIGNVFANGQLLISGAPGYDNLVLVNGVAVGENLRGQMRPLYVEDAIQETTILSGAISAEYGRFTGGVVSTITRSGGNSLQGSLRDNLSNPQWAASSPANEERPDTLNQVWEATLGGFAIRDRLWFFTAGRWAKNTNARQTSSVPAFGSGNNATPASPAISYSEENDQRRYEAKLTAQPFASHSLVASYFGVDTRTSNLRGNQTGYDLASLTQRDDPESLLALRWDAIPTNNLLVEAQVARREYTLNSGATTTDPIRGTIVLDRANGNARFNAPNGCAICGSEERDNSDVLLKASWFANTARFGSHHVVAGADRFEERRIAANRQSGSEFLLFATRAQYLNGQIYPVITPTTNTGGGTFIRWSPLLAGAHADRLRTDSLFLNDRMSIGTRWSISVGARFDRNDARDADGTTVADDSRISPRLAAQFDVRGDGRHRLIASFGEYASRVAESIAASNQSAGNAAIIDFAYRGAAINNGTLTTSLDDVLRLVFEQFTRQGGTANTSNDNLRANGSRVVPGFATYFDGSLNAPNMREWTAGYALAIGAGGFARIDYIDRSWRDFYAASVTTSTRRTITPLGIPVDLALYRNTNDLERTYRGVQVQTRWSNRRFDTGAHYTWSRLRGNDDSESGQTGAVANSDPALFYPELMNYGRFSPTGYLTGDQRHRLRAWGSVIVGDFTVSLLQSFDSGLPYSMTAPINVTRYAGAPTNPGYNAIPNGIYYFSERGALRTDDVTSTNLAVRWTRRLFGVETFVHADLLNALNESAVADPLRLNTTVATAATQATLQPFNPFTETPVLGTHYQPAATFGEPLNNLAYQPPREYRVSVGVRF